MDSHLHKKNEQLFYIAFSNKSIETGMGNLIVFFYDVYGILIMGY